MWRKQAIEKDKETAKTSKSIHRYLPQKTKRQRVASVPYSPPLHNKKKITSSKRQKINNKDVGTNIIMIHVCLQNENLKKNLLSDIFSVYFNPLLTFIYRTRTKLMIQTI